MNKTLAYIFFISISLLIWSCADDDTFSTSPQNRLDMSVDTVRMDTVFSNVPAATKSFWIYNNSSDGIRCSNVRLENGNQTGFRVNVDGIYLGKDNGFQTGDIEVRKGDSIRVFVEVTAATQNSLYPKEIEENLIFTLESGEKQTVNLNAWAWDAEKVETMRCTEDYVIDNKNGKPIIVYGGIIVDSLATLTIAPGSTIFFHDEAKIDVYGTLNCNGTAADNVTLRGDRLDNMFDYLPYDNLPGRWKGITFHSSSYGNTLDFTDLHSAFDAILCDSSETSREKLTIKNSTIHNCQGYGVFAENCRISILNSQITNTLRDCIALYGGNMTLLHGTIGQFYPFSASRGVALRFSNSLNGKLMPVEMIDVRNSIITGYSSDVIMAESADTAVAVNYHFAYSMLRTPEIDDSLNFDHIIWEDPKDTLIYGEKNFMKIDTDVLRYDFRLDSLSKARNTGNPEWAFPYNREGLINRKDSVNMGCY